MDGDLSPSKQTLRKMLLTRAAQKKSPKPKRMKRGRKTNKNLLALLNACAPESDESSMSDTDSENSFIP
nr:ORF3 [Torque teno felis virus]